ncbi:MAG: hypothetical protein JW963_09140 [Anaerolineales bacterium]|nr:hypothetical protein [Anaerolineales bacterium]
MKKFLFILMAALLVSVPLVTAQDDEVVLRHMVFETPNLNAEFWDNSIEAALADLPDYIKVEKITTPGLDRTAYAKQLLATGQLPDILQSINTAEFIEAECCSPLIVPGLKKTSFCPMAIH